jgi:hypothetical protein
VAFFYRGPNPFNAKTTLTLCNGMFGCGTYGAVRALTDARFRGRNEEYLRRRFADAPAFSVLSRVRMARGSVITPDWSLADNRIHEWSQANA